MPGDADTSQMLENASGRPWGTLYLVATPIGNLEDISLRALRVLKEVSLIAAEDTRSAHHLLSHFQITTPVTSYFEHSREKKQDAILDALERGDVAVISEAGMPGLSDPGYDLVRAAIAANLRVVPVPGPSALTTALVASGLPTDQFVYLGFLPREKSARRKVLRSVVGEPRTLVAYEAPHRVQASLEDIERILGDRPVCIARELTKMYEEFFRGTVSTARLRFESVAPRGEFTFVIAGRDRESAARASPGVEAWSDVRVKQRMGWLMNHGLSRTDAAKQVTIESGRERKEIYRLTIEDPKSRRK